GSLKSFDLIWAMTGGGPAYYTNLLALYTYQKAFIFIDYGAGSAVSTIMVILSIVLVILVRFVRRKVEAMGA
ncbi:MAG: sugar ABC transporter permease, partial [Actinobacteria bacterium]|nr:sugar ABC transporter permease [Actinomycetota bacterium]